MTLPAIFVGSIVELFICFTIPAAVVAILFSCVVYFFTNRARAAWSAFPLFFLGVLLLGCMFFSYADRAADEEAERQWRAAHPKAPRTDRPQTP